MDNSNESESNELCISTTAFETCIATDTENDFAPYNNSANGHNAFTRDNSSDDIASYLLGNGASKTDSPEMRYCIRALFSNIFKVNGPNRFRETMLSSVSVKDKHDSLEAENCATNGKQQFCLDLASTLSSEKIMRDIIRVLYDLIEVSYTLQEFDGNDLKEMNLELKDLINKGLCTERIALEMQKFVKENDLKMACKADLSQLLIFNDSICKLESAANELNESVDRIKKLKGLDFLTESGQLEKLNKGKIDIQRDLAKYKMVNIPCILEFIQTLEELGLLSKVFYFKLKDLENEIYEFLAEVQSQMEILNDTMAQIANSQRKVLSSLENKQSKKIVKHFKGNKCSLEHNIPFCNNCGWRNSWVKAFKKRGIYVKEGDTDSGKQIWISNTENN